MPGIAIEDSVMQTLAFAMDGLAVRQRVISNNLANINTPGFKASDVSFDVELERALNDGNRLALDTSQPQHIAYGPEANTWPRIITRTDTSQRADGNNVDLEREMVYLAETALHYQVTARMLARRLEFLRTVITEGRG